MTTTDKTVTGYLLAVKALARVLEPGPWKRLDQLKAAPESMTPDNRVAIADALECSLERAHAILKDMRAAGYVVLPIDLPADLLEVLEEGHSPFGEMRAAWDALVAEVLADMADVEKEGAAGRS